MEENTIQQSSIYSFSPPEKSFLVNLRLLLSKCHSFPIKQQFSSNHPIQALLVAVVIVVVSFFVIASLMYTHVMLILINQCLLNAVFSTTIALNDQSSPKQHFYYPHLSLLLLLFSSFSHSLLFISNVIKFQLTPLQLGFCDLCANQT